MNLAKGRCKRRLLLWIFGLLGNGGTTIQSSFDNNKTTFRFFVSSFRIIPISTIQNGVQRIIKRQKQKQHSPDDVASTADVVLLLEQSKRGVTAGDITVHNDGKFMYSVPADGIYSRPLNITTTVIFKFIRILIGINLLVYLAVVFSAIYLLIQSTSGTYAIPVALTFLLGLNPLLLGSLVLWYKLRHWIRWLEKQNFKIQQRNKHINDLHKFDRLLLAKEKS